MFVCVSHMYTCTHGGRDDKQGDLKKPLGKQGAVSISLVVRCLRS